MNAPPYGRIDPSEHASSLWRIGEIASDFELLDAWALPARGGREEFTNLQTLFADLDPADDDGSRLSRWLFALREWLGRSFGWDEDTNALPIPGCRESSLRDRLPADLPAQTAETLGKAPFRPIYVTETESAAELSNSTVHAILHLGWVDEGDGAYRGQMGVYVKARGRFGRVYMALIAPFRHHIVYPALMRRIGRAWAAR